MVISWLLMNLLKSIGSITYLLQCRQGNDFTDSLTHFQWHEFNKFPYFRSTNEQCNFITQLTGKLLFPSCCCVRWGVFCGVCLSLCVHFLHGHQRHQPLLRLWIVSSRVQSETFFGNAEALVGGIQIKFIWWNSRSLSLSKNRWEIDVFENKIKNATISHDHQINR